MESCRKALLLIFFFFISTVVLAQEDCTNGIDDAPFNGLIDCFDGDCAFSTDCEDFFFGNPVVCGENPEVKDFKIRTQWVSDDRTTNNAGLPSVGDIDFDGIPEVITTSHLDRTVTILNGATGETENQITVSYDLENFNAIGNIDGDECGDIFIVKRNNRTIARYDCELNLVYEVNASRNDAVGNIGLADFNEDGTAELYYRNEIMNAETGDVIVTGSSSNWDAFEVFGPVAVDILDDSFCTDCGGLELIVGNRIYAINIDAGTDSLALDMNDLLPANMQFFPKYFTGWGQNNWSSVSVADFNQDGHMDALMSGAQGDDNKDQTTIFFWDIFNNTVLTYVGNNHSRGTGRINIADVNGDGGLNASYVSNQNLYSLALVPDGMGGEMLDDIWVKSIAEGSSGFTGCSVFDFNDDGKAEIVYRSETSLIIIDGTNGATRVSLPCVSRTQIEYPIVADVDGDGASEICVACFTDDNFPFNPYNNNSSFGQIRIFEADEGENWQPSRSVWNQFAYFNVNINDDLTVPIEMQNHTASFSEDECTDGPNRALNTFLNQAPILEANGCPAFVSPELAILDDLTNTNPQCPSGDFEVTFSVQNVGDVELSGLLPVTFYDGNPAQSGSVRLNTEQVVVADLELGEVLPLTLLVQGPGDDFEVYVSINDTGTKDLPFSGDGDGPIAECGTASNIAHGPVSPTPFPLSLEKLKDNELCDGGKPNNGRARAFYNGPLGGDIEVVWLESFGDLPNNQNPDTGATAWSATDATNTDYAGVRTNSGGKAFEATDTDGTVVWTSEVIDISAYATVDLSALMRASSKMETNQDFMRVTYKLDGGDTTLFANGEGVGSFGQKIVEATGISGSTIQIVAYMRNNGNNETYFLDNVRVEGTTPIVIAEQTNGFTFYWYEGLKSDPSTFSGNADYEGALYPSMDAGTYSVFGLSNSALCYSDTLEVVIDEVAPLFEEDDVFVSATDVTTCDDPDGSVSAAVDDGMGGTTTDGYSFTWYVGNDFTAPIGLEPTRDELESRLYSVVVEDDLTGCSVVKSITVNSSQSKPVVEFVSKVDITDCSDLTAGSFTLSADGGQTIGYTFYYYEGTTIKAVADDFGGPTFTGLTSGPYVVEVVEDGSGCVSDPIDIVIDDLTDSPTPSAKVNEPNTGCDVATGELEADGDGMGTTAGYTFEWFAGSNTLDQYKLPNAEDDGTPMAGSPWILTGVREGVYTVKVTDSNGCSTAIEVIATADFELPTFDDLNVPFDTEDAITIDDQSANSSDGGYIEMPQLLSGQSAMTIQYWAKLTPQNYANDQRIFSTGSTGEGQVLLWSDNHDGLAFVVKATGGGRGRINSSYSATGWVQVTGTWDGATGEMKMYANGVLLGTDTYGQGQTLTTSNGSNRMLIGRDNNAGYGKYEGTFDEFRLYNRVLSIIEINETLCTELTGNEPGLLAYYNFNDILGTTVPDISGSGNNGTLFNVDHPNTNNQISFPEADIVCPNAGLGNNTSCDAANPNGVIDISDKVLPAGGDYTYRLYEGFSTATLIESNTTGVFNNREGGFYTVTVEDNTTTCLTSPATVSLNDLSDLPNIITGVTNDISCNNIGLGEIELEVSSNISEPTTGYTYEIFRGANTDVSNLVETAVSMDGSIPYVFDSLADGIYRIRVTNNDLTCSSFADVLLDDVSIPPTIRSTRISPNTGCGDLNNGLITVSGINDLGTAYPNDPNVDDAVEIDGAFNFAWFSGSLADSANLLFHLDGTTPYDSVSLSLSLIDPADYSVDGKYTVVAFSDSTGCFSSPTTRTIQNLPVYPDIFTSQEQPNTACNGDPALADGIAVAYAIDPAFVDPNDPDGWLFEEDGFTFEWFDNNTDADVDGLIDGAPLDTGDTTTVGLESATYYVQVTDNSSGCVTVANITIGSAPTPPVVALDDPNTTENTTCIAPYDGVIEVDVTLLGSPVNDFTGYTFTWYEGTGDGGPNLSADPNNSTNGSTPVINENRIEGLYGDTYTVVVEGPGACGSDEFVYTLGNVPVLPTPTAQEDAEDTGCNFGLGQVSGDADGMGTVSAGIYDFTWYLGTSTDLSDTVPGPASPQAFLLNDNPLPIGWSICRRLHIGSS